MSVGEIFKIPAIPTKQLHRCQPHRQSPATVFQTPTGGLSANVLHFPGEIQKNAHLSKNDYLKSRWAVWHEESKQTLEWPRWKFSANVRSILRKMWCNVTYWDLECLGRMLWQAVSLLQSNFVLKIRKLIHSLHSTLHAHYPPNSNL